MSTSVDIELDRAIATRIAVAQERRLRVDGKGSFSVTYTFGDSTNFIDFGAASSNEVAPPAGVRGELKDLNVYDVTETFDDDGSTPLGAHVLVGTAADTNAYGTFPNAAAGFVELASAAAEDFAVTLGVTAILPADTDFLVSFVPSNGAGPAGRAVVSLTINYFV